VKVEVQHATFSHAGGIAMILHKAAFNNARELDEHFCAVFVFDGDRISRLDTFSPTSHWRKRFSADVPHLANHFSTAIRPCEAMAHDRSRGEQGPCDRILRERPEF
jgi:hypothetical protein